MGTIRKRILPAGWYPQSGEAVIKILKKWSQSGSEIQSNAISCIVPHAGWDYSGELAFATLRCLARPVDTIAVIGGHLPPRPALLISSSGMFETPLGYLESDKQVLERLCSDFDFDEDTHADNTVEIQLPMIKYLYPKAQILSLRVSPTADAMILGKKLYALSIELNKSMVIVGSTDLTHYGPAYGFTPAGAGREAVDWVKEENDKPFLDFAIKMDGAGAIDHAVSHGSACSAGAAAAAVAFAAESGVTAGIVVGYRMSCDSILAESFVGYGGVVYAP